MHSRIFHIMPTLEDVQNNTKSYDDYSLESIGADYIVETGHWSNDIDWLMQMLPEGMFTMEKITIKEDEDTIKEFAKLTYTNFPTKYLEKWIQDIKDYASILSIDKLKEAYFMWLFRELVKNNDNSFYIDQGDLYADLSNCHNWIVSVANRNKIGDTFYIGSIMDYHF